MSELFLKSKEDKKLLNPMFLVWRLHRSGKNNKKFLKENSMSIKFYVQDECQNVYFS